MPRLLGSLLAFGLALSSACSPGAGCSSSQGCAGTGATIGSATSGRQILPDFAADPSARVWGEELWIYASHDLAGSTYWDMEDWQAFSSTDLVHWTAHGTIFRLSDLGWASRYAWAPDCVQRNGKYYFYFPADDQIGVAVADRPAGPFQDALGQPLIARNEGGTRAIDPHVFIDDDGQAYLFYGQNELRVVKLADDMLGRQGDIMPVPLERFHEGIWMHKRNGLYYLSYPSSDGTNASKLEYSIGKSVLGPFTYQGTIIDGRSRNIHGSITELRGSWYLFYHVQGPSPYERRVCAARLTFLPDGTIAPLGLAQPRLLSAGAPLGLEL